MFDRFRSAAVLLSCLGLAIGLGVAGCVPHREHGERLRYAIWGSVRQTQVEELIVAEFERRHPGVTVELVSVSRGYQEKMQASMVGGNVADVLMVDSMIYGDWAERDALRNVTALIENLDAEDAFMPVALNLFRLEDDYFALPINAGTIIMFCNLDAFDAAGIPVPHEGLTWPEFAAMGPKLARRSGNANAPTDYLCVAPGPSALMAAFGVELFDRRRNPTRLTVAGPAAVAAVTFHRRLVAEGWAAPTNAVVDSGANQLFRDGRVACLFSGRYASTEFANQTDFAWDVVAAPLAPGAEAEAAGTALAISSQTKVPELAEAFLRFYASEAAVNIAIDGGRIVPVRRRFAYGDKFLNASPPASMRLFSEVQEAGAGAPLRYGGGQREVHDILYRRLEQALAEPNIPAEEIVAGIEADLERWLRRLDRTREEANE